MTSGKISIAISAYFVEWQFRPWCSDGHGNTEARVLQSLQFLNLTPSLVGYSREAIHPEADFRVEVVLITVLGQNKCPEAVGGAGVGTEINFQQLKRGYEEEELKSELIWHNDFESGFQDKIY